MRIRRRVAVGTWIACKGCGKEIESGFQAGKFSRGEFCSRRCAKNRWLGETRPDHSAWMRDHHADKRAAREQQSSRLRAALERVKTKPLRTCTPLAIADEARDERDPLARALEKLRAEKASPVTPDNSPESPDTSELSTAVTAESETIPNPGPIEPLPGANTDPIERETLRLVAWASEILSRTR